MPVDYKLCAGTKLTVVVTNYETDCCKNWYQVRNTEKCTIPGTAVRIKTTVSSQCSAVVDSAMPTYLIRKAEHTPASNSDNLQESTRTFSRFASAGRV